MRNRPAIPALLATALLAAACTTLPSGPDLLALPGKGKSFEQFQADDMLCRQYAHGQVGGRTAQQAAEESGVRSAAVGTAVGAVAGAAIDGSRGAAVGAGTGLLVGSVAGTGAADVSGRELQRRYDHAYAQCMYAKGHRIPVSGRYAPETGRGAYPPPPPPR